MQKPPLGYDDESVIHKSRLQKILTEFERELFHLKNLIDKQDEIAQSKSFEENFRALKNSSLELGSDYIVLLDKLLNNYENFIKHPSQEKLSTLFSNVKSLQLLLANS